MWSIKEVKKRGKQTLKNNIWTLLLVGLFMSVILGKYILNNDGFSNLQTVYQYIMDNNAEKISLNNNEKIVINEYADKALSQLFTGNVEGLINSYNEKHNITKGIIFTAFNIFTKGQMQIQNTINSITNYKDGEKIKSIIVIIGSSLGILIRIFLSYSIRVGESRVYLESVNYRKTRIRRITFAFRRHRYINSVKTLLLMEIRKFLWNLTIIGGFIKNYSYKMVTFIIAENPNINAKDAIKISREMMNGNKFKAFKLDVSLLGWSILQYISFGILGIFVSPYYTAIYAELYRILREEYIENKKYKYELLNDTKLFEENELEKYPDNSEIKRKNIKIDYNKKYEATSIILFFFIFSFVGWLWEVTLYLFRDGILVNRGAMYGPWLPIYGVGCTLIVLLTKFKWFRKRLKNPTVTFFMVSIICTLIEYFTSWYIEKLTGLRYWDYTGVFMNINGRVCLECSAFFGLGGSLCIYIVAPFLERKIQRITTKIKVAVCSILVSLFMCDNLYSNIYPHEGEGITIISSKVEKM